MDFRISGLPLAPFAPLFGLPDRSLAERGVVRRIADQHPGFPCRVSLRDADLGEPVLLLNHEHLAVASPYRSRHAIYVREQAVECRLGVNEVPDALSTRLLSVRAFDADDMMVDADVVEGARAHELISRWFDDARMDYVHLHNAKRGCYAARADRAVSRAATPARESGTGPELGSAASPSTRDP